MQGTSERPLFQESTAGFHGLIFADDRFAYVPGRSWARIDLTQRSTQLYRGNRFGISTLRGAARLGVSGFSGPVGWDEEGHFVRFGFPDDQTALRAADEQRITTARANVEATPADARARRDLIVTLCDADRLDDAKSAALAWITAAPRKIAPRFALHCVERIRQTGADPLAAYSAPKKVFGTFGQWRLDNDPTQSTASDETLPAAMELPLAASREEWLYVEGQLQAVLQMEADRGRFHQMIPHCEKWEAAAKAFDAESSRGDFAFYRALALAATGKYEEAEKELVRAREFARGGRLWSESLLEQLSESISARTTPKLKFDPEGFDFRLWWSERLVDR